MKDYSMVESMVELGSGFHHANSLIVSYNQLTSLSCLSIVYRYSTSCLP
jgi:hypothetical protein